LPRWGDGEAGCVYDLPREAIEPTAHRLALIAVRVTVNMPTITCVQVRRRQASLQSLPILCFLAFAPPSFASLLCDKQKGNVSAKLFAGSQIFTNNPILDYSYGGNYTSTSTSSSTVTRDRYYTQSQQSADSSNGPLAGAELLYNFPVSRFSVGLGYSYSSFDTNETYQSASRSSDAGTSAGSSTYTTNYQSQTTGEALRTIDQTSIRLSGYYDLSKKSWAVKPYAIAAFVATNSRSNAYSDIYRTSSTSLSSDGTSSSGRSAQTLTNGTSSSWVYDPEIGVGFDIPLSRQVSIGSEVRYIPRNTDTEMPLLALGFLKYNFVASREHEVQQECESIQIKGKSASAVKALLEQSSPEEVNEFVDFLKTKRKLQQNSK